jgi:hypothetical protein
MVKEYPKYMILAQMNPATYPVMAMYRNEEGLKRNTALFEEKGLIHNPDSWQSEEIPAYLKPKEICVFKLTETIQSPGEVN